MTKIEKTTFDDRIHQIINLLNQSDINFDLDIIFSKPDLMNAFFKNKDLFNLFVRYIITMHKNDIINDVKDYYKTFINGNALDEYYFYNGEYSKIDVSKLQDNLVNEMLLINFKKTKDEYYNNMFETIKDYDIFDYNFPFNEIYLNSKSQGYKFNFLNKFYTLPKDEDLKHLVKHTTNQSMMDNELFDIILTNNTNEVKKSIAKSKFNNLTYDPKFGDAYILPYNYNNIAFKRAFFYLCSKHLTENDLNVNNLLNGFLNFESIFYSKNVVPNNSDANLITFIYFKAKNSKGEECYIPNVRYTIDLPGDTVNDKITQLKDYETIRPKFKEFDTKVIFDDRGVYFSTKDYNIDKIKEQINDYIRMSEFDEMLYYIFNSQFLSRSTCLFGYYIYYVLTGKIPKTKKYYDIIALSHTLETFKESLDFEEYSFTNKSSYITLNNLLDFIIDENN